jgi:internalin A
VPLPCDPSPSFLEPEVENKPPMKTRRHTRNLASLFAVVVLVLATLWGGGTAEARPLAIAIPDPGLEAAIRDALGKPAGEITEADMATLTSLDARERGIQDLTGLELATNLTFLQLFDNQVTDLSPLSSLASLFTLWAQFNQISDVSPLSSLTSLRSLSLIGNQISDVSPLSSLTGLTSLSLSSNQISDISSLSSLTNLISLTLGNNQISDVSPLSALSNEHALAPYQPGKRRITPVVPHQPDRAPAR